MPTESYLCKTFCVRREQTLARVAAAKHRNWGACRKRSATRYIRKQAVSHNVALPATCATVCGGNTARARTLEANQRSILIGGLPGTRAPSRMRRGARHGIAAPVGADTTPSINHA